MVVGIHQKSDLEYDQNLLAPTGCIAKILLGRTPNSQPHAELACGVGKGGEKGKWQEGGTACSVV